MLPLHITFSPFARLTLRAAFALGGVKAQIVAVSGRYDAGPVKDMDDALRAAWFAELLGPLFTRRSDAQRARLWPVSLDAGRQRTVWLSRNSTHEWCCFLEWLRQNGDAPFEMVDVTDLPVPGSSKSFLLFPAALGVFSVREIAASRFWELAQPFDRESRDGQLALWQHLRAEDAPLRIIKDGQLVSAPLDVYDDDLLAEATPRWKKMAFVIGSALVETTERTGAYQVADAMLAARMRTLIRAGRIEARGDVWNMHGCEVRLATG